MLRLRRFLAIAAFAMPCAVPLAAHAVEVGATAPTFELPGSAQKLVKLADLKGKLVYVDFWASWCGPCRKSFPFMNELQAKYGKQGLRVVGINLDAKREDALGFLSETPARFTVGFDANGDTPRAYAVKGMPSSVLVAPDGKVIWVHRGFNEADRGAIEARIVEALRTQPAL